MRVDAEVLEGGGDADDVDDGVERADLVELDLVGGDAVDLALGRGQRGDDAQRPLADAGAAGRPAR